MTVTLESELPRDIRGQYASDYLEDPDDYRLAEDPLGVKESRGDGNSVMHNLNLHDEPEADEATGFIPATRIRRVPEDPFHDFETSDEVSDISILNAVDAEIAKRRPEHLDAAERWLRQNDPSNEYFQRNNKDKPKAA